MRYTATPYGGHATAKSTKAASSSKLAKLGYALCSSGAVNSCRLALSGAPGFQRHRQGRVKVRVEIDTKASVKLVSI